MNKKLYNMMDWAAIEEVVYGECSRPDRILGARSKGLQTLVQAFFPGAEHVSLYITGKEGSRGKTVKEEVPMEMADPAGFFAALLPGPDRRDYIYHVEYAIQEEGKKKKKELKSAEYPELYGFGRILTEAEETRFSTGAEVKAYNYMGAHKKTLRGTRGVVFRVWAPDAVRVSLVGDHNDWDGLKQPMNRLGDSGIYELFVPGLEEGARYAYEVLMKGGVSIVKADPYSFRQETSSSAESLVASPSHKWKDERWMESRKKTDLKKSFFNLYTLPLDRLPGSFLKDKKAVSALADYVAGMGYTHVELLPVMEYPNDSDAGYHPLLFFAASARFGAPEDYMAFVDAMHLKGVGVILSWAPGDFSNLEYGLGSFDGSTLYEYPDPRQGVDPRTGELIFDLGRSQVREYLFSALNYWAETYHIDGFTTLDTASMLYLDYYRAPGEWVPNIYGGVENLEAISFLKEMNTLLHRQKSGLISIAAQAGAFPKVSEDGDAGLGFDLVTDTECTRELLDYLSRDPIVRRAFHQELTASMVYQYCEDYLLPVGLSNLNFRQGGLRMRMHGEETEQWKSLKLLYAYLCFHVGKCSNFLGQEYGELASYEDMEEGLPFEKKELQAEVFRAYMKSLYALCRKESAFCACDKEEDGFVWLLEEAADENVLAYLRQDRAKSKSFVCVFNFANSEHSKYHIPVEKEGKYKLIFSSDNGGLTDGATIAARKKKTAGRELCLRTSLSPLSVSVWQYIPFTAEESAEIRRREEERIRRRKEEESARKRLGEERARLRRNLKDELAKKIAEAEAAIAAGSEVKKKKK
ncbi:MAG: 1,4-alpha-glucan branching enzyme [Lachnospiraceae bacterium]|nr:1,4-alpha-glucan branching enzyme [Lachnospiraceae bacterium]